MDQKDNSLPKLDFKVKDLSLIGKVKGKRKLPTETDEPSMNTRGINTPSTMLNKDLKPKKLLLPSTPQIQKQTPIKKSSGYIKINKIQSNIEEQSEVERKTVEVQTGSTNQQYQSKQYQEYEQNCENNQQDENNFEENQDATINKNQQKTQNQNNPEQDNKSQQKSLQKVSFGVQSAYVRKSNDVNLQNSLTKKPRLLSPMINIAIGNKKIYPASQNTNYKQSSAYAINRQYLSRINSNDQQFSQFVGQRIKKVPKQIQSQPISKAKSYAFETQDKQFSIRQNDNNKNFQHSAPIPKKKASLNFPKRSKNKNKLYYHIQEVDKYRYRQSEYDMRQTTLAKKDLKFTTSRTSSIKKIQDIGRLSKMSKASKQSIKKLKLNSNSPQLSGSRFSQISQNDLLRPQIKDIIIVPQTKLNNSAYLIRTTERKSAVIPSPKKLSKPGFIYFQQNPNEENNNESSIIVTLQTKLNKIKQILVQCGDFIDLQFTLPSMVLEPPSFTDNYEDIYAKIMAIIENIDQKIQKVSLKKFRNCVLATFQKPKKKQHSTDDCCIIWHYCGRIYIGDFSFRENKLRVTDNIDAKIQSFQKHGVGLQWQPSQVSDEQHGYIYFGQFKQNKYDGYGIIRKYTKDVYIGLWKSGKKHGWGKAYGPTGHLKLNADYYEDHVVIRGIKNTKT